MPATLVTPPPYVPRQHPRAPSKEHRRHPRLECPPVRVSGLLGIVENISRGGLCLVTTEPLAKGQHIHLRLTDTMSRSSHDLQAVVVWVNGNRAGCRWVSPTATQDAWLRDRCAAWFAALDGASRR